MFNLELIEYPQSLTLTSNTAPEQGYVFKYNADALKLAARTSPEPYTTATLLSIKGESDIFPGITGRLTIYKDYAHFVWESGELLLSLTDWSAIYSELTNADLAGRY